MADTGSPFGGGFMDDLSSLLGGGSAGSGGGDDGPAAGSAANAQAEAASDEFTARLRHCEDIANGLA